MFSTFKLPRVAELRSLILMLGDPLNLVAAAFDAVDAAGDAVWMAEVPDESTLVWSSMPRCARASRGPDTVVALLAVNEVPAW